MVKYLLFVKRPRLTISMFTLGKAVRVELGVFCVIVAPRVTRHVINQSNGLIQLTSQSTLDIFLAFLWLLKGLFNQFRELCPKMIVKDEPNYSASSHAIGP